MKGLGVHFAIAILMLLCTCSDSQNGYVEEDKVNLLVELSFIKNPSEDVQAVFFKLHKTLNYEELNLFDHLSLDRMAMEQQKAATNGGNTVDTDDFNRIKAYRLELNNVSIARYRKPYNQLERQAFSTLLDEVYEANSFGTTSLSEGQQQEVKKTAAECSKVCFPRYLSFAPVVTKGISPEGYQLMVRCEEMECDYQFSFPCTAGTTLSSGNLLLALWMRSSGNVVARDMPGYTLVSIRKNMIDAAGGPEWCSQFIQMSL